MHDVAAREIPDQLLIQRDVRPSSEIDRFVAAYIGFINPLIAILLAAAAWIRGEHTLEGTYLALAAVTLSGYPIFRNSIISTLTNRKLNAEVLVSIALIASVWVGEYVAGAMVALMMNIGELIEDITIAKTGTAIRSLMDLAPETARIIRAGREMEVMIDDVVLGDIAVVRPGEKIPVDGTVAEGRGEVMQAAITGESLPVTKEPGDPVYGGTLNQFGALKVRVTRIGSETTLAKIIRLVQEAQAEKPPIERIADRFASWFTPSMLTLVALVFVVTGEVLRAVTVLVVACPCAMVIATPTAVVAGIGNAARRGILIKGGAVLEIISKLTVFVFDKTGTLTYGTPTVHAVRGFEAESEDEVLCLAGIAEKHAGHPLAEAVIKHAQAKNITFSDPDQIQAIVGRGVIAEKDGREIMVGNAQLFREKSVPLSPESETFLHDMSEVGNTGVLVGIDGRIVGGIEIADILRSDVKESLLNIRALGISRLIMLTGDTRRVAQTAAEGAELDDVVAELLPDQKLDYIRTLRRKGEKVAMVGDGINDAPSLVEADVGIAMGAVGTDAAIEAADIALASDDLSRAAEAVALSRKTIAIIKQSFVISLTINVLALILASTGGIGPIAGAFIHNIGSVIVVGNSSRLIGYRFK